MLVEQFTYKIPNQGLKLVLVQFIKVYIMYHNNLYNFFCVDLMT